MKIDFIVYYVMSDKKNYKKKLFEVYQIESYVVCDRPIF